MDDNNCSDWEIGVNLLGMIATRPDPGDGLILYLYDPLVARPGSRMGYSLKGGAKGV